MKHQSLNMHVDTIIDATQVLLGGYGGELTERQINFLSMICHNAQAFCELATRYSVGTASALSSYQRHQLANPLTPILGYSELLLSGALGTVAPAQHPYLEMIHLSARSLREVVDTLLRTYQTAEMEAVLVS